MYTAGTEWRIPLENRKQWVYSYCIYHILHLSSMKQKATRAIPSPSISLEQQPSEVGWAERKWLIQGQLHGWVGISAKLSPPIVVSLYPPIYAFKAHFILAYAFCTHYLAGELHGKIRSENFKGLTVFQFVYCFGRCELGRLTFNCKLRLIAYPYS